MNDNSTQKTNPTQCRICKKPHLLRDEDAGSERELDRLCVECFKLETKNDRQ